MNLEGHIEHISSYQKFQGPFTSESHSLPNHDGILPGPGEWQESYPFFTADCISSICCWGLGVISFPLMRQAFFSCVFKFRPSYLPLLVLGIDSSMAQHCRYRKILVLWLFRGICNLKHWGSTHPRRNSSQEIRNPVVGTVYCWHGAAQE